MNIVTRLSSNATQYDFISYRQHSPDHHQPGLFQKCSYYNTKWHELSVMIVLFNEGEHLIWSDFIGLSLEWEYEWCVNWAVLLLTRENRSMCRKEIDSPWSWLVCFCATVMIALMFGISLNFGVLFPVLMDYFQESREKTGNFMEETVEIIFHVWWLFTHLDFFQNFLCAFFG